MTASTFIPDMALVATATTGGGSPLALGAAQTVGSTTYQTEAQAGAPSGCVMRYRITDGTAWELCWGVYTLSGRTITRNTIQTSNNNTTPLTLSGTATVLFGGFGAELQPGWKRVAANYTAVAGDHLKADTSGGAFTVTLPASPADGDQIWVEDSALSWGTNALTIDPGSNSLDGATATKLCSITGESFAMVWDATASAWTFFVRNDAPAGQNLLWFGDGSDGNVTISSSVTLTRDMYYNNLTLAAGAVLTPGSATKAFRIFVAGLLDLSNAPAAAISFNGNAGAAATSLTAPGAGGTVQGYGTLTAGSAGIAGATGAAGAGSSPGLANIFTLGGQGGSSGASGAGTNAGHAAAAAASAGVYPVDVAILRAANGTPFSTAAGGLQPAWGGASGPPGGGDGTNRGGASGGGGAGGPSIEIFAASLKRGASTAAACIQCKGGGAGGGFAPTAGNTGGAGGSAGGGGGFVLIVVGRLIGTVATGAVDVTGGASAAGTNAQGTGIGGDAGSSGASGRLALFNLQTGALTINTSAAAVAGGAHSGTTGGTAATPTTTQVSL